MLPLIAVGQTDEEAIKNVITVAYVGGIHNGGSIEEIRKGFHPSFEMLRLVENDVKPLPLEEWVAAIEKARSAKPAGTPQAEAKFINVDITGNAAVVELELFREQRKIFTDYLVLYKFSEGWRIVSKSFYRHP